MASEAPQPRAESVSLSGAMARQGGGLYHGQWTGVSATTRRRVAHNVISCEQISKIEAGPRSCTLRPDEGRNPQMPRFPFKNHSDQGGKHAQHTADLGNDLVPVH